VAERLKQPAAVLFVLLALYFAVNIALRVSLPASLELDEAEQVFYSQWLMLGYGPQPPLYNWLQIGVFAVTGKSVFGLSLLKNLLLFATYLFYWAAARLVLKDGALQIAAVLGLLTLPQVSFMAEQDLAHTVALIAATALFLHGFYRIIDKPALAGYLIAGLAIGLGFLAKYNFVLLPAAALIATLPERSLRDRILNWRLAAAIVLAAVLVAPHLAWLVGHFHMATAQTLSKMTDHAVPHRGVVSALRGLGSLVVAIAAFSSLTMAVFVAIFRTASLRVLAARTPLIRITERMLLVLLLALLVVIVATGTTQVRERWLDPFLLVLPLYLAMKIEAADAAGMVRRTALLALPLAIMLIVPASIGLRVTTAPLTGSYTRLNVPIDGFARQLAADSAGPPAAIIAADRHLAGNLALAFAGVPVMTSQYPDFTLPWTTDNGRPVLLAWRAEHGDAMPAALGQWLVAHLASGGVVAPGVTELPYNFARPGKTYRFGYAWVDIAPKSTP
jgi:4-amino-4-deoxy-L-arabinose transferase-like glycosyltransferase